MVVLGLDGAELTSGLDTVAGKVSSVADGVNIAVGSKIVDAAAQGGAAIAGFVTGSIDAAGTFEANMNSFASVTGSSVAEAGYSLNDFSNKFLELGAVTAFSAGQAQDAAIALAKGGVSVTDIMGGATQATLDLAAAGGIELAQSADIVAKQLGVWSSTGVTAADVANQLAAAANASTVDADELAAGLANVNGIAKSAGVDFADLTTTMALLAPNFNSASEAGTSLKTMIQRLQPTTADALAEMQRLNLVTADGQNVFFDAQGSFLGMSNVSEKLRGALEGMSEAQRTATLTTLFGTDAITAAGALANSGADGYNAMAAAMQGAGTASEQAAKMQQGYSFALDSFLGSIETVQIQLGSVFLPILTQVLNDALIPSVNIIGNMVTAFSSAADPIAGLTAALNILSPGLGSIVPAIMPIVDIISANLVPILGTLAAIIGGVVIAALVSLVAPIVALAAPIAAAIAIAAAMYAAYQSNFMGIQTAVQTAITAVQAVITSVMSAVAAFWASNGAGILQMASNLWNDITELVTAAVEMISAVLTSLASFITANQAAISNIINGAWVVITSIFSGAIQVITGIFQVFTGLLQGDTSKMAEGVKNIFSGLWTALYGIVSGGAQTIVGLIQGLASAIMGLAGMFNEAAHNIGQAIIDGIVNAVSAGASAIASAVSEAANNALAAAKAALGIHSPSTAFYEIGKQSVAGWSNAITDKGSQLAQAVEGVAQQALGAARDTLGLSPGGVASGAGTGGASSGTAKGMGAALQSLLPANQGATNIFDLKVSYPERQSEASLKDDIKQLKALYAH